MLSLKERLLQILIHEKILKQADLDRALEEQKKSGGELSKILVRLKFVSEDDLTHALSTGLGMPPIDIARLKIDPAVVKTIPQEVAVKYQIMPISRMGDNLTLAMADPMNIFAIDNVKALTGLNIVPIIGRSAQIQQTIEKYYTTDSSETLQKIIKDIKDADEVELIKEAESDGQGKVEDLTEDAPMIKLTDTIIQQGVLAKASDVFIEPMEKSMRIRYRVDGIIREVDKMSKALLPPIISRIKVISSLDISEQRLPQDGRFKTILAGNREVDFRVNILPTAYGEKAVLRILDKTAGVLDLTKLGLEPDSMKKLQDCALRPHGMILCCGPTGSGKTTTLYAALSKINTTDKNIITIEDPIEYQLHGVGQIQVNPKIELTFANGLRSILRQDPDVIMVGEIRDLETAEIAIQAALTGHLVFSTLHTNDSFGAMTRLLDMGIEPFLVSSSVIAVMAQRLVRRVCAACREPYQPSREEMEELGIAPQRLIGRTIFKPGEGCPQCKRTGYRGRTGIHELLVVDDEIRALVMKNADAATIRRAATARGMNTLREDGADKVVEGVTTLEEVLRVTQEDLV